jgi:hypothetical protein
MRPSLTLILIILALLVSLVVGLVIGGGPQVWFNSPIQSGGTNSNSSLPVVPQSPTPVLVVTPTMTTVPAVTSVPPTATEEPIAPTATLESEASATTEPEAPETPDPETTETTVPEATETRGPEVLEEPTSVGVQVTIIASGLRLRAAPQADAEIVTTLPNGTQFEVLQRTADNGWLEVVVNDSETQGWLFADPAFVTIEGDLETLPVAES